MEVGININVSENVTSSDISPFFKQSVIHNLRFLFRKWGTFELSNFQSIYATLELGLFPSLW